MNPYSTKLGTPNGITSLGRTRLGAIFVNETLAGTLVIKDGATTVGTIAVGVVAGTYFDVDGGSMYSDLTITSNNAGDDFSVATAAV